MLRGEELVEVMGHCSSAVYQKALGRSGKAARAIDAGNARETAMVHSKACSIGKVLRRGVVEVEGHWSKAEP